VLTRQRPGGCLQVPPHLSDYDARRKRPGRRHLGVNGAALVVAVEYSLMLRASTGAYESATRA